MDEDEQISYLYSAIAHLVREVTSAASWFRAFLGGHFWDGADHLYSIYTRASVRTIHDRKQAEVRSILHPLKITWAGIRNKIS